jgi:gas vesicle protein
MKLSGQAGHQRRLSAVSNGKEGKMKYEQSDYETTSGSWLLTFILGGLIGAAVALLIAPKSGRQTREQLKDVAQEAKEKVKDIAQEAKEKAESYYDQAKSKVSDARQKSTDVFHHKKPETEPAASEDGDA